MFSFTFSQGKKPPTVDFLENGRIKHYLTCYVYKKSGLLGRERQIEKNQFQLTMKDALLEVDALFPDRLFSCLQSRPHSSNAQLLDFRARCNTHLMAGLPFLVEFDVAMEATVQAVTLSLHQLVNMSIGGETEDHGRLSRYVHQAVRPPSRPNGFFRDKDSARPLAHGRCSWLIEWTCPDKSARSRLPFESTFYSSTSQGTLERGLSLKVEVELSDGTKLAAVMHGLQYYPDWVDSRTHSNGSLRYERSELKLESPVASLRAPSLRGDGRPDNFEDGRRSSMISNRSGNSQHLYQHMAASSYLGSNRSPLASPNLLSSSVRGDYFGDMNGINRLRGPVHSREAKLTHGSYSPNASSAAAQLIGRSDSMRSTESTVATRSKSQAARSGKAERPDNITLPPASIRSSMSSAFENLSLKQRPGHPSTSSPTRRDFEEMLPISAMPTPPPTQPLPPAPSTDGPYSFNSQSPTMSISNLGKVVSSTEDLSRTPGKQKKATRLSRPAVILGVSQDTVQTTENADNSQPPTPQEQIAQTYSSSSFGPTYSASIKRASDESSGGIRINDRDSGFSETSYLPTSPLNNPRFAKQPIATNSSGFARRNPPTSGPSVADDDGGVVMLG